MLLKLYFNWGYEQKENFNSTAGSLLEANIYVHTTHLKTQSKYLLE